MVYVNRLSGLSELMAMIPQHSQRSGSSGRSSEIGLFLYDFERMEALSLLTVNFKISFIDGDFVMIYPYPSTFIAMVMLKHLKVATYGNNDTKAFNSGLLEILNMHRVDS